MALYRNIAGFYNSNTSSIGALTTVAYGQYDYFIGKPPASLRDDDMIYLDTATGIRMWTSYDRLQSTILLTKEDIIAIEDERGTPNAMLIHFGYKPPADPGTSSGDTDTPPGNTDEPTGTAPGTDLNDKEGKGDTIAMALVAGVAAIAVMGESIFPKHKKIALIAGVGALVYMLYKPDDNAES
jgi:hypothetical protein